MKTESLSRRSFMKTSIASTLGSITFGSNVFNAHVTANTMSRQPFQGHLRKSLYYNMFPEELGVLERFQAAKEMRFEGIEIPTLEESEIVDEFKDAAAQSGIEIHSIMNQRHWRYPLSSADPSVVDQSIEGMEISLRNARALGAGVVLLVPAVVNAETMYRDAYTHSQKNIKRLLPLAEELGVIIAIENVWNKFLLSPLEFLRYIEEIDSPFLKAYFDVGNIVLYGFPQDWIRTLNQMIVRIHIKGFNEKTKSFVNLREGTIDWPEVRRALSDIGYSGFINAELSRGDLTYLKDVSDQMDKIIAGE